MADDADIIVTAYGITARIALAAVKRAREAGVKAGFIRPISLWPFPKRAYDGKNAVFLCTEMSTGQMIEDVRLALEGRCRTEFFGRTGGVLPKESEIFERILEINGEAHG